MSNPAAARDFDRSLHGAGRATRIQSSKPRGFPFRAVLFSLALHTAILALLIESPIPYRGRPETIPETITVRLVARPEAQQTESLAKADDQPAPPDETPDDGVPDEPPETDPETSIERPDDQPEFASDGRPALPPRSAARPEPGISKRILRQIAEAADPAEGGASSTSRTPGSPGRGMPGDQDPASGLPGAPGWLSGHVGPVRAQSQQWQDSDGSQRAFYVLADGTVVCTRRRAPTAEELMNPWKSTAVTMAAICGRQRPRAPDYSDPRIQPPPGGIKPAPR